MEIGDDRAAHGVFNASLSRPRERPLLPPQPLHRRLPDLLEGHAARESTCPARRRARAEPPKPAGAEARAAQQFRGPYATAGPYERDGERVEVRLEKVPGGVRPGGVGGRRAPAPRARAARGRPARPGRAGARARAPAAARPRQARDGGRRRSIPATRPGGARARAGRATSRRSSVSRPSATARCASRAGSFARARSGSSRTRRRCCPSPASPRRSPPPRRARRCADVVGQIYAGRMPLKLVTGPANSAKAGEVLGGYRERLDEEPILVVPEFRDVEHAQREMAANGAVFGVRVARFGWLWDADGAPRRLLRAHRQLIPARAARGRGGGGRGPAACSRRPRAGPASPARPARFLAEVGRAGIEPDELGAALSEWAPSGARRAYASEIARDPRRLPRRARHAPGSSTASCSPGGRSTRSARTRRAWGATPVFVYGFDDFTEVELAGIEALAEHVDVTLSFPYERGRHAFDALAETVRPARGEGGRARRAGGRARPLRSRHRAPRCTSSSARLFDPPGRRSSRPARPCASTRPVASARRSSSPPPRSSSSSPAGTPAGDIAVVFRSPERYASLVDQVFSAYGIPFSLDRRVPLGHTRARPRPARAAAMRAARARRHDRRPPDLPALARAPRRARPGRPAGGQSPPGGHPRRRGRAQPLGGGERRSSR